VILADPETGACPGDDGAASTGDEETSDDGTGNTSTSDEDSGGGDDDAASGDVSTLPETGTGAMEADASHQPGALGLLLAAVVLCGAGCLTRRVRAG
jgi:hypothetical protein